MKQYQWNFWFVLSIVWLIIMFMLVPSDKDIAMPQLYAGYWFAFGACTVNLLGCIYVGLIPEEHDE